MDSKLSLMPTHERWMNSAPSLVVLAIVLNCVLRVSGNQTIRIGFISSSSTNLSEMLPLMAAADLAVEHLNTDPSFLDLQSRGYRFKLLAGKSDCSNADGFYQLVKLASLNNSIGESLDAVIGPQCEGDCENVARLASDWKIPTISFGCMSDKLSDKKKYSFFSRTITKLDDIYRFVRAVVSHFRWDHVTFITPQMNVAKLLKTRMEEDGFTAVAFSHSFHEHGHLAGSFLKQLASNSRVFLLFGQHQDIGDILLLADDLNMFNGQFVFMPVLTSRELLLAGQSDPVRRSALERAIEGLLALTFEDDINYTEYFAFNQNLSQKMKNSTQNNMYLTPRLIFDSFYAYGLAVQDAIEDGFDLEDRQEILNRIYPRVFLGASGEVRMDDNGDRDVDLVIKNIHQGQQVTVGYYNSSTDQVVFTDGVTIVWLGGSTKVPDAVPECGWEGEICQGNTTMSIAIGVTFAAIFVVIFLSAFIAYLIRGRRQQLQMQSMTWRISSEELKMGARKPINFGSRISKSTIDSTGKSMVSMGTEGSEISFQNQLFTSVSTFRGSMVAIKPIHKLYVAVTDSLIQEINMLRSLRHFNVNQLVGACIEPQKIVIVSHYCGRGSLADVLENERIKLDWIFKIAFAADIAHGMAFIHDSPVECHGRLKSSNVFIDSHWTCKIGDFAMPHFREGEKPPNNGKHAEFYQLLWTAPELLRDPTTSSKGTKKGDVYSFSIIMQEIVMRSGPYANSSSDPQEIVERVRKAEHPWFRPTVPSTAAEENVLDLMRICWEEIPAFRPNFVTIRDTLKKLNNGHKINLVDQMVHMMEKYADHLEELVEERTTQLAEEQKKTEELLCRMLPKKITADLKLGKHVPPETFECVTIFFSDIVGFTSLAHDSTPLEVVNFLNDLYTCFDTVIDTYDVYKVETIGDAYMVVSGLPVRNGIRHAGEIAIMALDLLSSVVNFRIRHRPEKQLQLRIGVHSGPCVAGVVGLKMPRYCLFGDTVNYASRMESSGLALRIHVSPECHELLAQLGGFHLTVRGDVAMKGKGVIQTYFLQGKDGFHKPLPDLSKAASLEEHQFK